MFSLRIDQRNNNTFQYNCIKLQNQLQIDPNANTPKTVLILSDLSLFFHNVEKKRSPTRLRQHLSTQFRRICMII